MGRRGYRMVKWETNGEGDQGKKYLDRESHNGVR